MRGWETGTEIIFFKIRFIILYVKLFTGWGKSVNTIVRVLYVDSDIIQF